MTAQHLHRARMDKPCIGCGKMLPLSYFYSSKTCADGLMTKCKNCVTNDATISYRTRSALSIKTQTRYAEQKPEGSALPRTPTNVGTYDGAELRPYTCRPGALDAYRLPSRGL